ncbi:MAG: two-component system copper resistance phosphate regulon response regulator CusR [Planctomycetota bacterium]|jgi:two-component system copper resistance phosphate regulon response regulator CusR
MKVLAVDDDPKFRSFIRRGLEESGIECATACDTTEALEVIEAASPTGFDLILLDVMMPDRTGWELLEDLRARDINTPVIFLTARHAVAERVKGLRLGADDYVIKPFEFAELLARIDAVMRRGTPTVKEVADLKLDLSRQAAIRDGHRIELSPREFGVLWALAIADGQPLSRDQLLKDVWEIDFEPGTNVVEVVIARLRRKLERHGSRMINTVTGTGYRLIATPSSDA